MQSYEWEGRIYMNVNFLYNINYLATLFLETIISSNWNDCIIHKLHSRIHTFVLCLLRHFPKINICIFIIETYFVLIL